MKQWTTVLLQAVTAARTPSFLQLQSELGLEFSLLRKARVHDTVASFSSVITLGSGAKAQAIPVMFDTGASDSWVISDKCGSAQCIEHERYHFTPTLRLLEDALGFPVSNFMKFLSGNVASILGREQVNLGDDVTVDLTLNLVTAMDVPILSRLGWDGIIGLGFTSAEQKMTGRKALIDEIKTQEVLSAKGKRNQFTYYSNDTGGYLSFGGADADLVIADKVRWLPVDQKDCYWGAEILDSYTDMKTDSVRSPRFGRVIFDTGTFLSYAPSALFEEGGPLWPLARGSCRHPESLPDVHVLLKGCAAGRQCSSGESTYPVELILKPDDYIIRASNQRCTIGIQPDLAVTTDGMNTWTFGYPFFKQFITIFDWHDEVAMIGIMESTS